MANIIEYRKCKNDAELSQILALQRVNLSNHISPFEAKKEGFVTLEHNMDLLRKMNEKEGHIIALSEDRLAGYALSMSSDFSQAIPELVPMFEALRHLLYKEVTLVQRKYIVMGQICIDKPFRGQGVFSGLYNAFRFYHQPKYDCCITLVACKNERSMMAHKSFGFESVFVFEKDDQPDWEILVWDWEHLPLSAFVAE